ncbi:MAG: response regulator [Desulfarculaceae bacterium]|nr:response regulator [Desulfarculaceae bacterium]MCF8072335.1 response regulator [Desulfarculaceae bacterium]MCF8100256.1 response regulator [Desulfarculaceae bacterium]MCF8116171.1 response regulator [Desulfarculaceae bacterium]
MAAPSGEDKRLILLVDDSATLRMSVRSVLGPAGYELLEAADGQEGLEALAELERQGRSPAMIISDVNMPRLDGIAFIQRVKQTPFKFLPILVLTTESEPERKLAGKQAGASGWLVKPFQPQTLLAVVKKFTRSLD